MRYSVYGLGNSTAAALGKTESAYAAVFATDGTIVEKPISEFGGTGFVEYADSNDVFVTPTQMQDSLPEILTASATLDFPETLGGEVSDLTITVSGAAQGDVVALGVEGHPAQGVFTALVTAADTVTVRYANIGIAAVDLGSGTFKVKVLK